jgi:hypothetical protein
MHVVAEVIGGGTGRQGEDEGVHSIAKRVGAHAQQRGWERMALEGKQGGSACHCRPLPIGLRQRLRGGRAARLRRPAHERHDHTAAQQKDSPHRSIAVRRRVRVLAPAQLNLALLALLALGLEGDRLDTIRPATRVHVHRQRRREQ